MSCPKRVLFLFALLACARAAQADRGTLCFNPQPGDRCGSFLITEFSTNVVSTEARDNHSMDRLIATDSFGLMRNLDGGSALGASLDLHLAQSELKFGPSLRYKRWLTGNQSLDLSLGYVIDNDRLGLAGPIGSIRYSPVRYFYLQAGACQFREFHPVPGTVNEYRKEMKTRVYGGLGFGGVPGAVCWGAQVVGVIVVAAAFASDPGPFGN